MIGRPAGHRALRLAHRGDHRLARENSLEALSAALELPAVDGVEFDVRASADGVAILLHDETLARVQGRPERAADLTADELARLGAPTLAEALGVAPAPAFLDIELKEDVAAAVVEAVRTARGDPPARLVVSSFGRAILARLAALAPSWPRWLNATRLDDEAVGLARALGCRGISAGWRSIDEAAMRAAAAAGLEVVAWTVVDGGEIDRLDRLGVAAICVEGRALEV